MKSLRNLMIVALVVVGNVSASAGVMLSPEGVMLSNLGQTGLENLSDGEGSSAQLANRRTAAGFRVETYLGFQINSVGVLMTPAGVPVSASMAIYSDNGGGPGTKLVESASLIVGEQKVHQFVFAGGYLINANTTYWAVVETGAGTLWLSSTDGEPTPLNSPSLTFVDYRRANSFNNGVWGTSSVSNLGFSVFGAKVIPEPALTSLLCFGGIALIRRRMKT
ncbi:MAG: choice-of-anchor R domain-containing protein [Pirellula sp.]